MQPAAFRRPQQHVALFDVAVDEAGAVHVLEGEGDVPRDARDRRTRHLAG